MTELSHSRTQREKKIGAIVLAAGQSRRMGRENKLLLPFQGSLVLQHVLQTVLQCGIVSVIVVTGTEHEAIVAALPDLPAHFVQAIDTEEGMSRSLKAGLAALEDDVAGALICLGDMPEVKPQTIKVLVEALEDASVPGICVPLHQGRRGNPVLWDRRFFPELQAIEGDKGGRDLLRLHAESVIEVPVEDPGIFFDIDTPEDLSSRSND